MSGSATDTDDRRDELRGLTLVIASPRSGSSLLCRDINSLGGLGDPKEYFLDGVVRKRQGGAKPSEADVLRMIRCGATEDTPHIGAVKLMVTYAPQVDAAIRNAKPVGPARAVQNIIDWAQDRFDKVNLIALTRQNCLEQAISHAVARMTGVWNRSAKTMKTSNPYKDVEFDDRQLNRKILEALPRVLTNTEAIERIAERNRQTCLKLNYEELTASMDSVSRRLVAHARRAGFAPQREMAVRQLQKLIDDEMAMTIKMDFRKYLERELGLW